jgi:hypothetical protein
MKDTITELKYSNDRKIVFDNIKQTGIRMKVKKASRQSHAFMKKENKEST